jgi:hypothetical protein
MSTIEEAAVAMLKAEPAVVAITTHHYPVQAPQDAAVPYTVYQVISEPELFVLGYTRPLIQFTSYSTTYLGARALADAVRKCFYKKHLTIAGVHLRCLPSTGMDGEPFTTPSGEVRYSRLVDVRFHYRNPT